MATIGQNASFTTPTFGQIRSMAVDNRASTVAFASTHTKLNDPASPPTSAGFVGFNPTPSSSGVTISHVGIFSTGQANFPTAIGGISLHNISTTNASVSGVNSTAVSSTSLVAGIDAQSLLKTSDFQLTITVRISYSSV